VTIALDEGRDALLDATEPPEARGLSRDAVRLLVGRRASGAVTHHAFAELPSLLAAGDIVVVNTSATLPAAVPVPDTGLTVHFSTELAPDGRSASSRAGDGRWLVELRRGAGPGKGTRPYGDGAAGSRYGLPGGASLRLDEPYSASAAACRAPDEAVRLWVATVDTGGLDRLEYLYRHGAPIRYQYVPRAWPLSAYQTVFARDPGSAEMPSAGRPFTDRIVTRLATAGVLVAPILLHTGVASPEAHERPYPERFAVPASTARAVTDARRAGGRVIAIGTTVVRALESAVDRDGQLAAASGYTDLIVTPERGVRVVDGLLTGFHEPTASHRDLLAAVAGPELLDACYAQAAAGGYRWHEFGDVNLLLP
jgi:S-adenosylmethionine:tRNA ribosyltransferase-isomerase